MRKYLVVIKRYCESGQNRKRDEVSILEVCNRAFALNDVAIADTDLTYKEFELILDITDRVRAFNFRDAIEMCERLLNDETRTV